MPDISSLEEKIKNNELRISKIEKLLQKGKTTERKKQSLSQFIRKLNLKNDVEKTLAIGYYFENFEDIPCFNSDDVQKGFVDAREKPPKNVSDKLQLNRKKNHIMALEEKKDNKIAYILTNDGIDFIEKMLDEE